MKFFLKVIQFFIFANLLTEAKDSFSQTFDLKKYMIDNKFFSRSNLEYITGKRIITNSEVTDPEPNVQTLSHYVAGIHEKNCEESTAILGKYEDYKNHIPFLEKTEYDGKEIKMILNAQSLIPLLPEKYFKFNIDVEIARLKGPGSYKYVMGLGIFQGLTGHVNVIEMPDKKCLFHINAEWKGKDTKLANLIVKNLTEMISKRGLEKLFSISGSQMK